MAKRRYWIDGCFFSLMTLLISGAFLVVNGVVVSMAFGGLAEAIPALRAQRVGQSVQFLLPIVMLFLEWKLLDLLSDIVQGTTRGTPEEK
ncbi:MAG TPA: hypothetical protein VGN57_06890 [Pirellulaceae bacterium]|nr:hypothetical protein [Pirellulaceae bacterium]